MEDDDSMMMMGSGMDDAQLDDMMAMEDADLPEMQDVVQEDGMGGEVDALVQGMVELYGVLKVEVHAAKELVNADVADGSKSDPYVCLFVDYMEESRTAEVQDSLNPTWNETLETELDGPYEKLQLAVIDADEKPEEGMSLAGTTLGVVNLDLEALRSGEQGGSEAEKQWYALEVDVGTVENARGQLQLTVTFQSDATEEEQAQEAADRAAEELAAIKREEQRLRLIEEEMERQRREQDKRLAELRAKESEEERKRLQAEQEAKRAEEQDLLEQLHREQQEMRRKQAEMEEKLRAQSAELKKLHTAEAERAAKAATEATGAEKKENDDDDDDDDANDAEARLAAQAQQYEERLEKAQLIAERRRQRIEEMRKRQKKAEKDDEDDALPTGIYTLRHASCRTRFVDAYERSRDHRVVTRGAQGDNSQRWVFMAMGNGLYTIQQKSSGRYLDAYENGHDFSVVTRKKSSARSQLWRVVHRKKLVYTIQQASSGRYLDGYDSASKDWKLVTRPHHAKRSQRWIVAPSVSAKCSKVISKLRGTNRAAGLHAALVQPVVHASNGLASYVVQRGDTLSKIAKRFYGKARHYPHIFASNRGVLKNPNLIYPGQVLVIPPAPRTVSRHRHAALREEKQKRRQAKQELLEQRRKALQERAQLKAAAQRKKWKQQQKEKERKQRDKLQQALRASKRAEKEARKAAKRAMKAARKKRKGSGKGKGKRGGKGKGRGRRGRR